MFEFQRDAVLNANNFFSNESGQSKPSSNERQYGGTLGGPVDIPKIYNGHNRTFFFVNSEIVRYIQGVTFTATLPSAQHLSGNFATDLNSAGQQINTLFGTATADRGPRVIQVALRFTF